MHRISSRPSVLLGVLVCIVGILALFGADALALYYQAHAGQWLSAVKTITRGDDVWLLPRLPVSDPQARNQVTQAISDLQTALQYHGDSQSYLLLGRAFLLSGESDRAAEALRSYVQMRPKNPLGHLELGFAYEAECLNASPGALAECPNAIAEWQAGGMDPSQFITRADTAFKQSLWADASVWYRRERWRANSAEDTRQPPFDLLFREMIAAVRSQSADAPGLLADVSKRDNSFDAYSTQDLPKIDGVAFRWMNQIGDQVTYGTPLSNGGSGSTGFLWWTGQATAVLSVERDGNYIISARVRHSDPPPVEMALGIDGKQLEHLNLARGDNSWETIHLPVSLTKGLHTLDVWYLNDAIVNGKDRDAVVEWVTVEH